MDEARLKEEIKEAVFRLVVGPEEPVQADCTSPEGTFDSADVVELEASPTTTGTDLATVDGAEISTLQKQKAASSKSKSPLVFSLVDIASVMTAGFLLWMHYVIYTAMPGTSIAFLCQVLAPAAAYLSYSFFQSYWFADATLRLHKITNRTDLGNWYEKLALINPLLLWPIFCVLMWFCSGLGLLLLLPLTVVFFGACARWLYLTCNLCSASESLSEKLRGSSKSFCPDSAAIVSLLTLCALLCFAFFQGRGYYLLPFTALVTLVTGFLFSILRNGLIRLDERGQLDWPGEISLGKRGLAPTDVHIRYNHFIEIKRWFRQRASLRSTWKTFVLVAILLMAAACNLHGLILHSLSSHAGTVWLDRNELTQAGVRLDAFAGANASANYWLVFSIVASAFGSAFAAAIAYIRAPKGLAAGPEGLRLMYGRFSPRKDLILGWGSFKGIKVGRPTGKTSAANDKLVFERHGAKPLTIKLAGISSAEDKEKLLAAITNHGQEISRDATVEVILQKPVEQSYTELWLQALAAPPKREKLKPLSQGIALSEGRYEVIRQLGVGGQGFAYLAIDKNSGKEIVLKESVLPVYVDIKTRRDALTNFEKEAKLLSSLNNPQVVKLEGFFVEDHRAYLVLEHIDGESLRQLVIRSGPLPEEQVRELAKQMCSILAYLHDLSPPLVHRDFTPDNLILRKDGTLKLIDFNVAQQCEYATTGTVVGKQAYLPPEQFRGQATTSSDLYALGATLYFLASGKDPTPISVARPIKDGVSMTKQLDGMISALTSIDSSLRPASAHEVSRSLEDDDGS